MKSWDKYYIEMAMHVATKSKDPSTQVGCVLVGYQNEIISTGFNGFPRGVREETELSQGHAPREFEYSVVQGHYKVRCTCGEVVTAGAGDIDINNNVDHDHFHQEQTVVLNKRWERPAKYEYVEHAERNAVYNAARSGVRTEGAIAYLNWQPTPCVECTKAFIQAGIDEVVGPNIPFPANKDWKFEISQTMLNEAQIETREVPWDVCLAHDTNS